MIVVNNHRLILGSQTIKHARARETSMVTRACTSNKSEVGACSLLASNCDITFDIGEALQRFTTMHPNGLSEPHHQA